MSLSHTLKALSAPLFLLTLTITTVFSISAEAAYAQAHTHWEDDVLLAIPYPNDQGRLPPEEVARVIADTGSKVEREITLGDRVIYRIRANGLIQTERQLAQSRIFQSIQRNYCIELAEEKSGSAPIPDDPHFPGQSCLTEIGAVRAWEYSQGPLTVGIIDSGVQSGLDDLQGKIAYSRHDASPGQDRQGHGTSIASVIAANTFNRTHMAAVAPAARIFSCKAVNSDGYLTIEGIIEGLVDCIAQGVRIANIGGNVPEPYSLSNAAVHPVLHTVFNHYYQRHGGLLFLPAGNRPAASGMDLPLSYLIVVEAGRYTSDSVRPLPWATRSGKAWLAAPGEGIVALNHRAGRPVYVAGSSYSSALAAAVAALTWGVNPNLTNRDVAWLLSHASRIHQESSPGAYPRLEALAAVQAAQQDPAALRIAIANEHYRRTQAARNSRGRR